MVPRGFYVLRCSAPKLLPAWSLSNTFAYPLGGSNDQACGGARATERQPLLTSKAPLWANCEQKAKSACNGS